MNKLIDEIRINPYFTQLLQSEYQDGDVKSESEPKIRKSLSSTCDYLKKVSTQFEQTATVLPPNCRYLEKTPNGTLVVIEEPPAFRTIKVSYNFVNEIKTIKSEGKLEEYGIDEEFYSNQENRPFHFNLAFPYVIFIMTFDRYNSLQGGQVFLRNARLSGLSDYLLKMPMMNISSEQYICYGDRIGSSYETINAAIENTIMVFWSAIFNPDYTYNYSAYKETPGIKSYLEWQALSQRDPMFIYSVEWIKMERNLFQAIRKMKDRCHIRSIGDMDYRELAQIFTQPAETGKEESPYSGARTKQKLFYDIAQGIYLDSIFYIHVGDPVIWGKGRAFVDSFIGFFESDQIRFIRLDLGDKLISIRYTKEVRNYLLEGAKKLRFEETGTLRNGTVIKEDDIVVIKGSAVDIYKKVVYIRKSKDGLTEARLGNSFYILENLDGEVLDLSNPSLNDVALKRGERYLLLDGVIRCPFSTAYEVEYETVDVDKNGNLKFIFYGTDKNYSRADQRHVIRPVTERGSQKTLIDFNKANPMPPVFRVGRKIFYLDADYGDGDIYAWGSENGVHINSHYSATNVTGRNIERFLLFNKGTTFHVESYDTDITFNIGDKVVGVDWENPINMLMVKTIESFKIDNDRNSLSFVLSDKNGNLSEYPYIVSNGSHGSVINVGKIRKIVNKYENVSAGTKIIAQKGYIPYFPKKDVNIIIGFITDTGGEPLVLCSNCCTLWYSDMMENFKRVTMRSKKWAEMEHAHIDINKIKFQPGDILKGSSTVADPFGWMIVREQYSRGMRVQPLSAYTRGSDTYTLDSYMKNNLTFDCILNPRISPTEQTKIESKPGFPNFHGLFIENGNSRLYFLNDERSLINVQSSCE